jgi:hypothetical protein
LAINTLCGGFDVALMWLCTASSGCCTTALFATDFLVAVRGALNHVWGMSQTLERRVEELEHKLADLTMQFAVVKSRQKDWRRTFGLSRDDEGFKDMMRLGREYRQSLRHQGNGAGFCSH